MRCSAPLLSILRRMQSIYKELVPYEPPTWIGSALRRHVPSHRLILSKKDTPIEKWNIPSLPAGFSLSVKRDDLTGNALTGNKVRKLEFLLADAKLKGCTAVVTSGGLQSNHCRATAIAAREIGLDSYLLLRSPTQDCDSLEFQGNLLLDRMVGSKIYLVPLRASQVRDLQPRVDRLVKELKNKCHVTAYPIPIGGSNLTGLWGYIDAFRELIDQGVLDEYTDLVFPCGSGGTACGLAIANFLTGSKLAIHGIAVCDDKQYFYDHANETLAGVGLSEVRAEDILDIVDGYKGKGYGVSSDEDLEFIWSVSRTTGIFLDRTYTGKAARGMIEEMKIQPERFKGKRVLFVHTGGIFGLFDGRTKDQLVGERVHAWFDLDKMPQL